MNGSKYETMESENGQNLEEINRLNADIAGYKEQLQLVNASEQSSNDNLFHHHQQTVKGLYPNFVSTTDLGPMLAMQSKDSISINPVQRQGTDTMVSAALGNIVPETTSSPRGLPGAAEIAPGNSEISDMAKIAELQLNLESLALDLEEERKKHETELEKETEVREAERVKHQGEIGQMQEETHQLREEILRLKTEIAQSKGCCGTCSIM